MQLPSKILSSDIRHDIMGIPLILPCEHMLPVWQKKFPKYDKFLYFLVKKLPENSNIVDVGANCGDTLAAILSAGPHLRYLCIEPSAKYYSYLLHNIKTMRRVSPQVEVITSKSMVGTGDDAFFLDEVEGTGRAFAKNSPQIPKGFTEKGYIGSAHKKVKLSDLIYEHHINPKLIKVDVDGFDYDVINSCDSYIFENKPIIYFEWDPFLEPLNKLYQDMISKLYLVGYTKFNLFNNHGEHVLTTDSLLVTLRFIDEFYYSDVHTRIYNYFDILINTAADDSLVSEALSDFNQTTF